MNILDLSFNDNFSDSESDGFSINDISLDYLHESIVDLKNQNDLSYNYLYDCINNLKELKDISSNEFCNIEEWTKIDLPINDNFEIINNK